MFVLCAISDICGQCVCVRLKAAKPLHSFGYKPEPDPSPRLSIKHNPKPDPKPDSISGPAGSGRVADL